LPKKNRQEKSTKANKRKKGPWNEQQITIFLGLFHVPIVWKQMIFAQICQCLGLCLIFGWEVPNFLLLSVGFNCKIYSNLTSQILNSTYIISLVV